MIRFKYKTPALNCWARLPGLTGLRHELDITGRVEGVEEAVITAENSLKGQATFSVASR